MKSIVEDYQRSSIQVPDSLLTGLDAWLHSLSGSYRQGGYDVLAGYLQLAEKIDNRKDYWHSLSREKLHRALMAFKEIFRRRRNGYTSELSEALGAIREAAFRTVSLMPYKVQLVGSLALYNGYIAEMATGEGKTLVAAMAATLHGWEGKPCHIITVNDYLASRDKKWMEPFFQLCGVSVGYVTGEMDPHLRREGYHKDVTYTTSKELVADFLRDKLWLGDLQKTGRRQIAWFLGRSWNIEQGLVMRGIYSVIVDEADSILIDEAVTQLIISRATENEAFIEACRLAYRIADSLEKNKDYKVDKKYHDVEFKTDIPQLVSEELEGVHTTFQSISGYVELIHQALVAKEFFHLNEQYVLQDNEVVIVDEFTGRQMPMRKWRAGIHQFVEAKEDVEITAPTETLARLSFQRFFRFFKNISGMTGTAKEADQELWDIYEKIVIRIPENKPCRRKVHPTRVFPDQDSKWQAIVAEIRQLHHQGCPVLVGTRSVKASEHLASLLTKENIEYQLLNAKNHYSESTIVAAAGEPKSITIATNMAGRGTDIRLGKGVPELGGLHVIATECHESRRIDRQLFGRCARQGDPGNARLFISMDDELMRRYLPGPLRDMIHWQLEHKIPGAQLAGRQVMDWAQYTAQNIAYRRRRSVLKMDTWLEDSLSFAHKDIQ